MVQRSPQPRPRRRAAAALAAAAVACAGVPALAHAAPADASAEARHVTGTLANGTTYDIQVPAGWNGTLVLHSHGFRSGPDNPAVDAGFAPTAAALTKRGYAVAQSSYARTGWALGTAVDDQLDTLAAFRAQVGAPTRTIAFGRSMGGLVTAMLAERKGTGINGAVATCGLLGGGLNLNNYQLDGAQAAATLLLPGTPVRLTKFASVEEAAANAKLLVDAVAAAKATPEGRARIALAATLMNMPTWATGDTPPAADDADAIVEAQAGYLMSTFPMAMTRRVDIQEVSGGDSGYNRGVDYAALLRRSDGREHVARLYRAAGLDLRRDLARITRAADVTADPAAVRWMARTSTPTGRLQMPVLTMHTLADPAAPVEYTTEYGAKVRRSGANRLLAQSYVQRIGHCTFTPAENLAAIGAMEQRLDAGRWTKAVRPNRLQEAALATGEGTAAFVAYRPGRFVNDRADRFPFGLPRHGRR